MQNFMLISDLKKKFKDIFKTVKTKTIHVFYRQRTIIRDLEESM